MGARRRGRSSGVGSVQRKKVARVSRLARALALGLGVGDVGDWGVWGMRAAAGDGYDLTEMGETGSKGGLGSAVYVYVLVWRSASTTLRGRPPGDWGVWERRKSIMLNWAGGERQATEPRDRGRASGDGGRGGVYGRRRRLASACCE
jgi:hypothetical protein